MRKLYIVFILLVCISNIAVLAEDFYGKIVKDDKSEATVILVELDIIEISDEEGNFAFYGVEPGEYTLKVITIEEKEMDFSITVNAGQDNSNTPEVFEIINIAGADDVVEEEIIITAERDIQQEPNTTDYSTEFVENMSIIDNDPFNIIANEAGVYVEEREITPGPFTPIDPSAGRFFTQGTNYSVYGGDTSWNQNYLDFLPMPTNIHLSDKSKSIITKESTGTIKTIKGPPPGRYGQSLGGTIIVYPKEVTNNSLSLGLSITDPHIGYSTNIGEHVSLFTIARHSISQYTTLPIFQALSKRNDVKLDLENYIYGDWLFSLKYAKEDDVLKILSLVYYDLVKITAKRDRKLNKLDAISNNLPYFFGEGIQWRRIVAQRGLNVLDVISYYSASLLNNDYTRDSCWKDNDAKSLEDCKTRKIYEHNYKANSSVWTVALKEVFSWALTDIHLLSLGTSLEYSNINASYEDKYVDGFKSINVPEKKHKNDPDTKRDEWPEYEDDPDIKRDELSKYTIDETIFHSYFYTQYDYEDYFDRGNIKFSFSPGISWILEKPTSVYPSVRGEVATTVNDIHTISLAAGWSPAFLEKLQYIDRKILEKTVDYKEGTTNYTDPNYGVMFSTKYLVTLGNHQLSITPYFGWYYNFNGIFSRFRYDSTGGRGYSYKAVNHGFGTGATLRWKYSVDKHSLSVSYNIGFIYFNTKENEWIPTIDDTRHTIQLTYLWKIYKAFNFSLVNSIYFDKPFTPIKMAYDKTSKKNRLTRETGDLNSARSYIPTLSLVPSFTGAFLDNNTLRFNYRFALGDLLSFINYNEEGPKDTSYEGASNKDIDNRNIKYELRFDKFVRRIEIALYLTFKL